MTPPALEELGARMWRRGGERAAALDRRARPHRVILAALPAAIALRFDPAAAGELHAILQLDVLDPQGGPPAPFTLAVDAGRCRVTPGASGAAGAVVAVAAGDLIRLVSGAVRWTELMATGRLTLGGDPFLALRFPALFGLTAG